MGFLEKIYSTIEGFDRAEFYRATAIAGGIFLAIGLGTVYYYYSRTSTLQADLRKINKSRQEVQQLLQQYKAVLKQKEEVNTMLNEEKSFKIKNFFDSIVQQYQLQSLQKKEAEVTQEVLYKEYTEIKLTAQFKQMNTQQLCELLNAIEQKTRVYVKELSIIKSKGFQKESSLDVSLIIATLQPQNDKKAQ